MASWLESLGSGIIRGILNTSLKGTTETQLKDAIRDGTSLWRAGEGEIRSYAGSVPPFILEKGNEFVKIIEEKHGGFTPLVTKWLAVDQPRYCSIIMEAPGGYVWLDKQVYDILRGIGILK